MAKALKVLQRVKKMELDENRRGLLLLIDKQTKLKNDLRNLMDEYKREKEFAAAHPLLCDFGSYTEQYLKKKRNLENDIAELEKGIEQIRETMAGIFKEQKTYNIIDNEREKKTRKKYDAEEQKLLDETGANAYIKKHSSES